MRHLSATAGALALAVVLALPLACGVDEVDLRAWEAADARRARDNPAPRPRERRPGPDPAATGDARPATGSSGDADGAAGGRGRPGDGGAGDDGSGPTAKGRRPTLARPATVTERSYRRAMDALEAEAEALDGRAGAGLGLRQRGDYVHLIRRAEEIQGRFERRLGRLRRSRLVRLSAGDWRRALTFAHEVAEAAIGFREETGFVFGPTTSRRPQVWRASFRRAQLLVAVATLGDLADRVDGHVGAIRAAAADGVMQLPVARVAVVRDAYLPALEDLARHIAALMADPDAAGRPCTDFFANEETGGGDARRPALGPQTPAATAARARFLAMLGLSAADPGVDQATIQAAYRRRVLELHPDKGGRGDPRAASAFRELQSARADYRAHHGRAGGGGGGRGGDS